MCSPPPRIFPAQVPTRSSAAGQVPSCWSALSQGDYQQQHGCVAGSPLRQRCHRHRGHCNTPHSRHSSSRPVSSKPPTGGLLFSGSSSNNNSSSSSPSTLSSRR